MALLLQKNQTPEMAGIPPEAASRLVEAGGKLELPPVKAYIRLGTVSFPQPRHLILNWEVWPSKAASREFPRKVQPQVQTWLIAPEPQVLRRESRDADDNVLEAALCTPTFDAVMSLAATPEESTIGGCLDAIRTAAYALAADWPDFAGAERD